MILATRLQDKLDNMQVKYEKVQRFADKLPFLKDYILDKEIVESAHINFGDKYKSIPLSWGIRRGVRSSDSNPVTNCKQKYHNLALTNIYINTLSLYDRHNKYGIEDIADKVFFYDPLNTSFYATDEQLEDLLESLNDWYLIAKDKACIDNRKDKLAKLDKERERLLKSC